MEQNKESKSLEFYRKKWEEMKTVEKFSKKICCRCAVFILFYILLKNLKLNKIKSEQRYIFV